MGYLFKQNWKDVIAIAIETGVQNTGLAIFALRFSLPQPEADLTTGIDKYLFVQCCNEFSINFELFCLV